MNRGAIPGYYYDEEKKKYFKIQKNHIAPPDSKYSAGNVKREQRESKKRKIEASLDHRRRRQTVPAARLLQHSLLGGSGLRREHGTHPNNGSHHVQRESAFAQAMMRREIVYQIGDADAGERASRFGRSGVSAHITDFHYLPGSFVSAVEPGAALVAVTHNQGSHCLYSIPWSPGKPLNIEAPAIHCFHDPIISAWPVTVRGNQFAVACTAQPGPTGNVFVGPIENDRLGEAPCIIKLGDAATDRFWDCKINLDTSQLALAGTSGAHLVSLDAPSLEITSLASAGREESYACEWLGPQTLAVGLRQRKGDRTFHDVYLWDIRTHGFASRIVCSDLIVGLHKPDHSDSNLLVASNRNINLHDLRLLGSNINMDDRNAMLKLCSKPPLLTFDHPSGSRHLEMTTLNGDMLAAIDYDNLLQVYSLRTGRSLRTLKSSRGLLQKPRWVDDNTSSPLLQVCAGNTVQQWSW